MIEQHDYPVTLRWIESKLGEATSSDRLPALNVATPPEFGGPSRVWSPEHLLVASVASCFMTTFLAIAANSQLEILGLEVPATGRMERGPDRRYSITRIELRPRILIAEEAQRAKAERLAHKADALCLISRSLRSEVALDATIEVEAVQAS
jgi:organic hydroperoxide reductase OsmC/OhrA